MVQVQVLLVTALLSLASAAFSPASRLLRVPESQLLQTANKECGTCSSSDSDDSEENFLQLEAETLQVDLIQAEAEDCHKDDDETLLIELAPQIVMVQESARAETGSTMTLASEDTNFLAVESEKCNKDDDDEESL
mmetsp:Transcript_5893/g.10490  ORF Transcript_5893/g.10490 Transcript_5893/m.10490 type:complete len:136 (-) Transcript_5893:34-441(-)